MGREFAPLRSRPVARADRGTRRPLTRARCGPVRADARLRSTIPGTKAMKRCLPRVLALAPSLLATSALVAVGSLALADQPQPKPAFAGQTQAPPPKQMSKYRTETITDKLTGPWAIAFLPDGKFLISERRGNLRTVTADGKVSDPIAG